jgi:hypothetical protein
MYLRVMNQLPKKFVAVAVVALALLLTVAGSALAQQQSVTLGTYVTDGGQNGALLRVRVDSEGKLLVSGSTGGGGTPTSTDAGVSVTVPSCSAVQDFNTTVGTSSVTLSALAGRWMTRVCNSARNTGNPIITCTSDGTTPTIALTSVGETLEPGDCAVYTSGTAVRCISDTASTAVTSWDCR